jgi:hypothetical protein
VSSHVVRREVIWAMLGMEAAVVMPIMAMTAPGEGSVRLVWTVLLLLLLPAGYVAVRRVVVLRDPAWRVLAGFLLVVLLRLQAPLAVGEGAAVAMGRFLQAIVPACLAFALWWRGGSFVEAEMTAADVHLEFLFGGAALLVLLVIFHGIVAIDPQILFWAAGLFAASGLVAVALARQDAADAAALGGGGILAATVAVLPIGATLLLLVVARPDVMTSLWTGLAQLIELALLPIFWLLAWLASLLPAAGMPSDVRPVFRPPPRPPNLDALAREQGAPDWIPWLALTLVLLVVLFVIAGVLRLLLESELVVRHPRKLVIDPAALTVERSGGAGQDARHLLRWLFAWLAARRAGSGHGAGGASGPAREDAWTAYQALLAWAAARGVHRRTSETTQELQHRLVTVVPESADTVGEVTTTYEHERYGGVHAPQAVLQRLQAAVRRLLPPPTGT